MFQTFNLILIVVGKIFHMYGFLIFSICLLFHCYKIVLTAMFHVLIEVHCLQLQKQLQSVILAFLLIGYKCIREATTELCFSKVNDFVKCTVSSLEKLIGGEHFEVTTGLVDSQFSLPITYICHFIITFQTFNCIIIS